MQPKIKKQNTFGQNQVMKIVKEKTQLVGGGVCGHFTSIGSCGAGHKNFNLGYNGIVANVFNKF